MKRRRSHSTFYPSFYVLRGLVLPFACLVLSCRVNAWQYPSAQAWGPLSRQDMGAAVLAPDGLSGDNTLIVAGGRNGPSGLLYSDLWWSLDAVNWRTLTPMRADTATPLWPGGRWGMGFAASGSRLVTWVGRDNTSMSLSDSYYSIDKGVTWKPVTAFNFPTRYAMATTTDSSGVIWSAGGFQDLTGTVGSEAVLKYTFTSPTDPGSWTFATSLGFPSAAAALLPVGSPTSNLVLIGGLRTGGPTDFLSVALSYCLSGCTSWLPIALINSTQQRVSFAAVATSPSSLVMFGGSNNNNTLTDFWASNDGGVTWASITSTATPPNTNYYPTATTLEGNRTNIAGVLWRGQITSIGSNTDVTDRRRDIAVLPPTGSFCARVNECAGGLFCVLNPTSSRGTTCVDEIPTPCTTPSAPCLHGACVPDSTLYPPYYCDCGDCFTGSSCQTVVMPLSAVCNGTAPTLVTDKIPDWALYSFIGIVGGLVVIIFVVAFVCYYKNKNPNAKPEDVQKNLKDSLNAVGAVAKAAGTAIAEKEGKDSHSALAIAGKGLVAGGTMAGNVAKNASTNAGNTTGSQLLNNFAVAARTTAAELTASGDPEFKESMNSGVMAAATVAEALANQFNTPIDAPGGSSSSSTGGGGYRSFSLARDYTDDDRQQIRLAVERGLSKQSTQITLQIAANLAGLNSALTEPICK